MTLRVTQRTQSVQGSVPTQSVGTIYRQDKKTAMRTLMIEPLTKEAFAPFGDVIETDGSDHFMINNGSTMRFHKLATVDTAKPEDHAIISIFRADAQDMPLTVCMLEDTRWAARLSFRCSATPF